FWSFRGYLSEGRTHCEGALALRAPARTISARVKVCLGAARLASDQVDHPAAAAHYQEGLVLSRELGDRHGVAQALFGLGSVAWGQDDYAAAEAYCRESLEIRRGIGDPSEVASSLQGVGWVAKSTGNY